MVVVQYDDGVFIRDESLTHHMNQMKLINAIAQSPNCRRYFIGTSLIAVNPATAGRFYSLTYNVGISKNKENPRLVVSDGSRLSLMMLEENKNPLKDGGYGYTKLSIMSHKCRNDGRNSAWMQKSN